MLLDYWTLGLLGPRTIGTPVPVCRSKSSYRSIALAVASPLHPGQIERVLLLYRSLRSPVACTAWPRTIRFAAMPPPLNRLWTLVLSDPRTIGSPDYWTLRPLGPYYRTVGIPGRHQCVEPYIKHRYLGLGFMYFMYLFIFFQNFFRFFFFFFAY